MSNSGDFNIIMTNKTMTRAIDLLNENKIEFKRIGKDKILISSVEFLPALMLRNAKNDIQDKLLRFLLNKCPDLSKLMSLLSTANSSVFNETKSEGNREVIIKESESPFIQMIRNFKDKKVIVKGFIQSGKTNFIITASALFNFVGNKNIVIITRNSTDEQAQLKNRIVHFNSELRKVIDSKEGDFFSKSENVFVEIGNASRIKTLIKTLKKKKKDYVLFIDEVDFMDTSDTKTVTELVKLKENAYCNFGISATIMDSILKTEDTELIVLSKPENYRGIESFITKNLLNATSVLTKTISDPIVEDTNLNAYLDEFSEKSPYFVPLYSDYHPVDTLIRVSKALDPNRRLLSYIATRYPSIPCMFYSGNGSIELYLPNITTPIKLVDGQKSKIDVLKTRNKLEELDGVYHFFTSTSPSCVKEWLYENGGVAVYPRIITLAGQLASRCISYGASNFEKCKAENKLWWHLTEMYLSSSASTDQPELMQTAGRLCVATPRGDNIPLTLYSTKEVEKDLVKAYWLQEELIDRSNEEYNMGSGPFWKLIQDMPIYKGKIPTKKRSLTKKVEYELNKVHTKNDGGYDIKEYKFDNETEQEKKTETPYQELTFDLEDLTERRKEVVRLLYKSIDRDEETDWVVASRFYRNAGDQQAICNLLKGRNEVRIRVNNEFLIIRKLEKINRYEFKVEV